MMSGRTFALSLLLSLVALGCDSARVPSGPVLRHVRVVWTESPQTDALVAWSTLFEGSRHRIYLDTRAHGGDLESYARVVDCQRDGRHTSEQIDLWYHHARLDGLEPGTKHWFVVASDDERSSEMHFVTAPAEDVPVVFLQGGDSRSDALTRRSMNRVMRELADADPRVLCLAHGGDYVWSGDRIELWARWLDDHELTIGDDGHVLPIVPARGNHEATGTLFDEVFGWPGGGLGRNWFSTELTPRVLLVTLNSEAPASGPQTEFLADTADAHRGARWKIAQYHRPIFPAVKRPALGKRHWQPVFEAARFDLVCEADGHTLRRTKPVLGDEIAEDGVVYIGEGGLGVPQRTPDTSRWFIEHATSTHHVWRIELTPDLMTCSAITISGQVADSWSRAPRTPAHAEDR